MDGPASAMKHLEHLCVEIGPRPVGSRANQAAADYVCRVFEACGLKLEVQEFACPLWEVESTRLEFGEERLVARANAFSPACDVVAEAAAVGTLAELEAAELSGCIAILHGDLTKGTGLSCRHAFYFPERDQQVLALLEAKRPAALVTVNQKLGASFEPLMRDWEIPVPSATVPAEVGLALLRQVGRPLHLRIDCRRWPGRFANVVARKEGPRPERIALCAHLDTVDSTPGAADNGAGVAVLLALAESLAAEELSLGLEWVVVNGEENGGLGDLEYLCRRGDELGSMLALVNVDGVGEYVGTSSAAVMGGSPALDQQVVACLARYPGMVRVDPWYESDHTAFLGRGVPCIPLSTAGGANTGHTLADTVDWISPAKLGELIGFIGELVRSLQDRSAAWCRPGGSKDERPAWGGHPGRPAAVSPLY